MHIWRRPDTKIFGLAIPIFDKTGLFGLWSFTNAVFEIKSDPSFEKNSEIGERSFTVRMEGVRCFTRKSITRGKFKAQYQMGRVCKPEF
jgi:hypothetical protein